jgi:hypothetical protein
VALNQRLFCSSAIVGAVVSVAIYAATTDSSQWNLGDAAREGAIGALAGFTGVGLIARAATLISRGSRLLRAGSRFVGAARSVVRRVATRVARPASRIHGNSYSSPRLTHLYRLEEDSGRFLKWGMTSNPAKRYTKSFMSGKTMRIVRSGPRRQIAALERRLVERSPGPLNRERWAGGGRL